MQAIKTKYLPCTNYKCSRIKAIAEAGNVTLNYEHGMTVEENHMYAAEALMKKLQWDDKYKLTTGVLSDCYVHVLTRKEV